MRLLVCGGRDFADRDRVFATLDNIDAAHCIDVVIHGAARGADTLVACWAAERHVPCWSFPADWRQHGNGAGPVRNQQMLDEAAPTHCLAFPGGAGTADIVRRAMRAGIPILEG